MWAIQRQDLFQRDSIFNSVWLTKFINKFMKHGRKSIVEKTIIKSFISIKDATQKKPILLLLSVIVKTRPVLSFVSKRKGKRFIDIPIPLPPKQQLLLSLKWIVLSIKMNRSISLKQKVSDEFLSFLVNKLTKLKMRKKIFLNRAFHARLNARYRWK